MSIPKFLQPYLASYDLKKLNENSDGVKKEIISQILNLGSSEAVNWVFQRYSIDDIKKVLSKPSRGSWHEESLNYWQNILGVTSVFSQNKNALLTNP